MKILLIWIATLILLIWYLNHEAQMQKQFATLEKEFELRINQNDEKSGTKETYNRSAPVIHVHLDIRPKSQSKRTLSLSSYSWAAFRAPARR